ncbi:hypothetical protein SUGI_0416740 [Cryptomeria japonica]|nr:hypothetical protein SUGI_0416740 [Cryptomeria japonica]
MRGTKAIGFSTTRGAHFFPPLLFYGHQLSIPMNTRAIIWNNDVVLINQPLHLPIGSLSHPTRRGHSEAGASEQVEPPDQSQWQRQFPPDVPIGFSLVIRTPLPRYI